LLRKSVRSNNFFRQNSQDDMQDRAAYVCHGQELDYIIYFFYILYTYIYMRYGQNKRRLL
jgi:hypothetical protein